MIEMTDAELSKLARNLVPVEPGFWCSASRPQPVSYPEGAHAECYELEDGSFWFRHRNGCVVDLVRRYPPSGPIFDVGGGNGFVALALQRAGFPAVLVEPSSEGPRLARARGLKPVVCARVEDAGFAPGALLAVGIFDVLEHIEDDRAFLGILRSLISPGGRLYVTVPALGWLWSGEDEYAGHYRRYRLGDLVARVEKAGFRCEFASYFFMLLPLPIFLQRSLPSRLGRKVVSSPGKYQREHNPNSKTQRLLEWTLRRELAHLKSGRSLPLGSSCLLAATAV